MFPGPFTGRSDDSGNDHGQVRWVPDRGVTITVTSMVFKVGPRNPDSTVTVETRVVCDGPPGSWSGGSVG